MAQLGSFLTVPRLGSLPADLRSVELAAYDSRVLSHARSDSDFAIPNNKYRLADASYGLKRGLLTPYRGVRYHSREQAQAN